MKCTGKLLICLGVAAALSGMMAVNYKVESKEGIKMNRSVFVEVSGCTEKQAEKAMEIFEEASGHPMETVEVFRRDRTGDVMRAEADGTVYYLYFNPFYCLEEIRKNQEKGIVLFQVNY